MRATDGFQTTINLSPVNCEDQTLSLELELKMALPMPNQDEHLPDQIETVVHQAGLEAQRRLFQALLEKADQQLVLQRRQGKGGAGIQRRGTRPFTFKTIFGEVTVRRSRICHNYDDTMEVPSATAWNTSHQLHITGNLRDAVCDRMSDQSAGKTRADICQQAGDENLLGRSTIIDIVHQEGKRLTVAQRERARAVLDGAPEAQLALLGPAVVAPDAVPGLVDDDLPFDDSEEAQAEWEQTFAEWIATGFPGCEPAFPVDQDKPRAVLEEATEAQLALLGPAVAGPDAMTVLVDDDLPFDDSEKAQAEWEQTQAEWIATGFPGCEPACPVAQDEPRAVDEGFVTVEPDEVKTKAQPSTGCDYQQRQRAGLWIASTRVEKYNDWAMSGRCTHQGMSWSPPGVLALAAFEAERRNGEIDAWRRDRALPERALPELTGLAA